MKPIPVIALLFSVAALAIAIIRKDSPALPESPAADSVLQAEVEDLRQRLAALEALGRPAALEETEAPLLEKRIEELSSQQQDIAELALSIDSLGVIETQERELVNAYNILVDEKRPAWERAKQAGLLKRYGQFDQGAVDSMWKLFSDPKKPYDQAAALLALKGLVTREHRDDVLTALNLEVENGFENGRLRYYGIEALEPLARDAEVRDWLTFIAQNDPEPKIAGRAAKMVGLPPPAGASKRR